MENKKNAKKSKKVQGEGEKRIVGDKFYCEKCKRLISNKKRRRHKERCGKKPLKRGKGTQIILTPQMMERLRRQMMERNLPSSVETSDDNNQEKPK